MLVKEKKIWIPDNNFLLEYHARIECGWELLFIRPVKHKFYLQKNT